MVGASSQIGMIGTQDLYLTGNPQITYFKAVYRRYTNFAIEAVEQTYNGLVSQDRECNLTCILSRSGDLVKDIWVEVDLSKSDGTSLFTGISSNSYVNWTNNTGHAFLKKSQLYIGSDLIDEHDSRWLDIWNELTDHEEKEHLGLNKHNAKNAYLKSNSGTTVPTCTLHIPLKFWFNRNPGLAIPIVSLNFSDVKLVLKTRDLRALLNSNVATNATSVAFDSSNIKIFADYIYLDAPEKQRFSSKAHEYLIEQVQFDSPLNLSTESTQTFKLNFSHPVKELIWVFFGADRASELTVVSTNGSNALLNKSFTAGTAQTDLGEQKNDYFNYSCGYTATGFTSVAGNTSGSNISNSTAAEHFGTFDLKLDNSSRFPVRKATYFRTCQPIQAGHRVPQKHIYLYSFALNAEDYQPSGTCNFSKVDSVELKFNDLGSINGSDGNRRQLAVYAVNYNILRIMSGMGGLAYTN